MHRLSTRVRGAQPPGPADRAQLQALDDPHVRRHEYEISACSATVPLDLSLQLLGLDPRAHVAPVARILSELRSVRHRGSEAVSHRAMLGGVRAAQCVLERIVVLTRGVRDLRCRCPESGSYTCKEIHLSSGAYEPPPARTAGDLAPAIDEHQPDPHGGIAPPVTLHHDDRDLEPCE